MFDLIKHDVEMSQPLPQKKYSNQKRIEKELCAKKPHRGLSGGLKEWHAGLASSTLPAPGSIVYYLVALHTFGEGTKGTGRWHTC
jgi:hypothetical protein